jgi:hypothetical protein
VAELERDPRWLLAVVEPAGMLFVRRDAFPPGVAAIPKTEIWPQVLAETADLDGARARFARGIAFFRLREFQRAAVELAAYGAAYPEDGEAAQLAALLQASLRGEPRATAVLEDLYRRGRGE